MTVTETLDGLGSWELRLVEGTPDSLLTQLGYFGHVAIVAGPVDVEAAGDGLLTGARYVGVARAKGKGSDRRLAGSGMVFWLGDEDNKGHVIENEVALTAQTFTQSITALLPATVTLGTIHPGVVGTYTGKHVFQSPRQALRSVCEAFGRELRVNGNASVDFGTQAQLYTAVPDSILVRKGAGADLDLTGLSGQLDVDGNTYDYSTRVVLLGQTVATGDTPAETFATGSTNAPVVPYVDLRGNPVKFTRLISESGETQGSVAARAQLQLNRFNRVARSLKISLDDYEIEGNFRVGDMTYVYDPETEIFDPAREVDFRGELLHPDIVRVSGMTWPVARGMTVAFRTQAGVWLDLTPFVIYETGATEVTIGDLPRTLNRPGDDPIQVRVDSARGNGPDGTIPKAPTGLTLISDATVGTHGNTIATLTASWTAVTQNTDNSAITDLSHYEVTFRPTFRAGTIGDYWEASRVTTDTRIDITNVAADLSYDVRVAAVDKAGNRGAWSSIVQLVTEADDVAPPTPADPVASTVLGQSRIEYTGVSSSGTAMPADTNRVDVHIGTTAGFTPTAATRVASLNPFARGVHYATVPYGAAARWAKLVAVDHTGNVSGASASVPLTASPVVSADVFDGAIGTAKLADLAVTTAKIGNLAVNDAKIGNVAAGKITAGTVTAEIAIAGRFTTSLTGARREMNAIGFQAFDASEQLTINLDGVNNLLTGRFRTAITGRRIEMGTVSSGSNRILFIAPDGQTTQIGAFTGANTGEEAIRIGVPTAGVSQFWNQFQMDSGGGAYSWGAQHRITVGGNGPESDPRFEVAWATSRGSDVGSAIIPDKSRIFVGPTDNHHVFEEMGKFYVFERKPDDSVRARIEVIGNGGLQLYALPGKNVAVQELRADATAFTRFGIFTNKVTLYPSSNGLDDGWVEFIPRTPPGAQSPRLKLITQPHPVNGSHYSGLLKFAITDDLSSWGVEVRNSNDSGFERLKASAFEVNSSELGKEEIRDLGDGSMAELRGIRVKRYRRKGRPAGVTASDEIGIIAEQAPTDLVRAGRPEDGPMVDLYALTCKVLAGLQEVDARLDVLEGNAA